MNFTREPIIESIISARDGYNLLIKPFLDYKKTDYMVGVVEVVSYGGNLFYRSVESKHFLLSVHGCFLVEEKDTQSVPRYLACEQGEDKKNRKDRPYNRSFRKDRRNSPKVITPVTPNEDQKDAMHQGDSQVKSDVENTNASDSGQ